MFSRLFSWRRQAPAVSVATTVERVREKYLSFRELLALNTECLELISGLQEDLNYVPPKRDVIEDRVAALFDKAQGTVAALEKLTGYRQDRLRQMLDSQQNEIERYIASLQELVTPRLAAWLREIGIEDSAEAGGKAAALGEVKRKLGLPVPDGYVLTTEAYRQFCGIPHWQKIRDAIREVEPTDLEALRDVSRMLQELVLETPLPRAVEVAITDRARALKTGGGLAVRSSAVGEGPEGGFRTCAGQFLSLLNVPVSQVADAYKQVIASRFSERALSYRLSSGLVEVETPMAVLVLPIIDAAASGIMYTRDPSDPKSKELWITATTGLGLDIASGRTPADLFVVSRKPPHQLVDTHIAAKSEQLAPVSAGGLEQRAVPDHLAQAPSIGEAQIRELADYGVRLEEYFKVAQDVEWAMDQSGRIWILQTRPLALVDAARGRTRGKTKAEPLVHGGRTIYPGQVSGPAFVADDVRSLGDVPKGSILFLRRASPEIVRFFSRISGLVAEWGNVTGHAAALLREFKIPSVFLMPGILEKLTAGQRISLDSVQAAVYPGTLFEPRYIESADAFRPQAAPSDPISRNILTLNLLDPSSYNFRPAGCKSTHDVLRYCHEKSVEAMFTVNDIEMDHGQHAAKDLKTDLPLNLCVLDLGGGLRLDDPDVRAIEPSQIVSLPFRALWRGISHPDVTWRREMPASLSDLASVMGSSLKPQDYAGRPLGGKSYLLVAEEYMNLNARLAYHFSLIDASLTDIASENYIAFRFAGGGASRYRRNLRACFVEGCLRHYGFLVDRRGDLVNAWLKKAPATETYEALDILGRLMACTSQLDMYMTSPEVMRWYVRQFLEGNYKFERARDTSPAPA